MTNVERQWFRRSLLPEEAPPIYNDKEDADFHPPPQATLTEAFAAYWDEIGIANSNLAASSMDDRARGQPDPGQHAVRRTIVHMNEEYARHSGHADLLRQAIDGATGD